MKYIALFVFFFTTVIQAASQGKDTTVLAAPVAKPTTETTAAAVTKEKVGTLEAEWKPVVMEHYVGIRGGYGMGSGRFEPIRQMSSYMGMLSFGISYRFDAPVQKYVGCIEVGLSYMQKGYQYETYAESGIMYSRKYSIIELPILWQPYLPLSSKNSASRFYLSAGPYIGYAINSDYRIYEKQTNQTIESGKYDYNSSRDNRFECGVVVGAGFQVAIKRFAIGAEFRYTIMLSNVFTDLGKYEGNPFFSPVDAMNLSIGISYKILTKEHKSKSEK